MKIFCLLAALLIVGCSSAEKRNKWTDKSMTLMLDPETFTAADYVAVQTALIQEGSFTIVDRASAFNAVKKEQERTHRKEIDRFNDFSKYAQWGKLHSVGSVVIGHSQCFRTKKFFSTESIVNRCKLHLALVDSNTGEVIAAVDDEQDSSSAVDAGSFNQPKNWKDVVAKLINSYPKDYKPNYYSDGLERYRNESAVEAQKQREAASQNVK